MAAAPISIRPTTFLALSMSVVVAVMAVASSGLEFPIPSISSIAASPAAGFFPPSPLPALSPDTLPLFPSPGTSAPSPKESPIPTIPSSQSPPNPDAVEAAGPDSAMSPSGTNSLPSSSAFDPDSSSSILWSPSLALAVVVVGSGALWIIN